MTCFSQYNCKKELDIPFLNGSFKRDSGQLLCSLSLHRENSNVPGPGVSISMGRSMKTLEAILVLVV